MKFKYLFVSLVSFLFCNSLNALELKTHLYLGEQILADLQDGKIP